MTSTSQQARAPAGPSRAGKYPRWKDGERFDSRIFIIDVGPESKEYAVHESVLRTSVVFAAMCEGQFKEAHERRISLPAENPQDFAAIVEYMYTKDFVTIGNPYAGLDHQTCAFQLASLYVTADYYQMDPLKALIVEKFERCTIRSSPSEWLAVAESIYPSLPPKDEVYPAYVRSLIIDRLESCGESVMEELDQWTRKGGRLAVDINRACVTYWKQKAREARSSIGGFHQRTHHPWNVESVETDDAYEV